MNEPNEQELKQIAQAVLDIDLALDCFYSGDPERLFKEVRSWGPEKTSFTFGITINRIADLEHEVGSLRKELELLRENQ